METDCHSKIKVLFNYGIRWLTEFSLSTNIVQDHSDFLREAKLCRNNKGHFWSQKWGCCDSLTT